VYITRKQRHLSCPVFSWAKLCFLIIQVARWLAPTAFGQPTRVRALAGVGASLGIVSFQ
jgi:hypothetical protein